jgi:hypothetical protein
MMRENFDFAMVPTAFGEPRAKRWDYPKLGRCFRG